MAKINITPEVFADIVVSFLYDKMLHPDEVVPRNKEFEEVVDKMAQKSMKPILLQYYLNMDANQRLNYKRIKDVFDIGEDTMTINIKPEREKKKKKKESVAKRVSKRLLAKEEITINDITNILAEELEEDIV